MSGDLIIEGKAAIVGPNDVLVISMKSATLGEVEQWSQILRDRLGERFLVVCGEGVEITVQQGGAPCPG